MAGQQLRHSPAPVREAEQQRGALPQRPRGVARPPAAVQRGPAGSHGARGHRGPALPGIGTTRTDAAAGGCDGADLQGRGGADRHHRREQRQRGDVPTARGGKGHHISTSAGGKSCKGVDQKKWKT
ncbi:hypothetical protein SEVIR_1G243201v4 [Setaria viridis]